MTDSLNLAELHRTNIEYERQRHLANWLIKSSAHMAKPASVIKGSAPNTTRAAAAAAATINNKQKSNENGTITHNPLLFFTKFNHYQSHPPAPPPPLQSLPHHNGINSIKSRQQVPVPITLSQQSIIAEQYQQHQQSQHQQHKSQQFNQLPHTQSLPPPTTTTTTTNISLSNGTTNAIAISGLQRNPLFNSQTNLPLQIITTTPGGNTPKLKRFNTHDTSANMFSVADFQNARLARRNEMEMKQRQQPNRYKLNSLSSVGDYSTGDSKGSRVSNESNPELLPSDLFLEKYPLPRVVRASIIQRHNINDEGIQSLNSSSGSANTSSSIHINNNNNNSNNNTELELTKQNGELYLLYRHLRNRKVFHGQHTKNGAKKKGIKIPQEFLGYFSFVNEKGASTAIMYTSLVQLVRERVYKFLSVDNLSAYSESPSTDNFPPRPHYVKGTARGGQIFRLLAVFEDGGKVESNSMMSTTKKKTGLTSSSSSSSPSSSSMINGGREKEKGRYAQLLNENRQVIYVSLTSKGKFYEIEQSTPQIFQKTTSVGSPNTNQNKSLNIDCIHRINNIISDTTELPIALRFIAGGNGGSAYSSNGSSSSSSRSSSGNNHTLINNNNNNSSGSSHTINNNVIPEYLTIVKLSIESLVIACPIIDEPLSESSKLPLQLRKLQIHPDIKFIKCFLGFETEQKMFSNQNIQNILKFCQFNYENICRLIEYETVCVGVDGSSTINHSNKTLLAVSNNKSLKKHNDNSSGGGGGALKMLKPLHFPKLLRREKSIIAHEKEESIIFLTKNDLENLELNNQQNRASNLNSSINSNSINNNNNNNNNNEKMLSAANDMVVTSTSSTTTTTTTTTTRSTTIKSSSSSITSSTATLPGGGISSSSGAITTSSSMASITQAAKEKMKVFQPTKKNWFKKHLKSSTSSASAKTQKINSLACLDVVIDTQTKRLSMDRYQDMSKLLQERFDDDGNGNAGDEQIKEHLIISNDHQIIGNGQQTTTTSSASSTKNRGACSEIAIGNNQTTTTTTTTSITTYDNRNARLMEPPMNRLRQKSISLQDIDIKKDQQQPFLNKPDLIKINFIDDDLDDLDDVDDDDDKAVDCQLKKRRNNRNKSIINNTDAEYNLTNFSNNPPKSGELHTLSMSASMRSSSNNRAQPKQQTQSFITEKLYSEFHVKTKQYLSKSSSSIHQLLHFSVPQKMNVNETRSKYSNQSQSSSPSPPSPLPNPSLSNTMTINNHNHKYFNLNKGSNSNVFQGNDDDHDDDDDDDVPYSSVRDSLICDDLNERIQDDHHENIYAEICTDNVLFNSNSNNNNYNYNNSINNININNNNKINGNKTGLRASSAVKGSTIRIAVNSTQEDSTIGILSSTIINNNNNNNTTNIIHNYRDQITNDNENYRNNSNNNNKKHYINKIDNIYNTINN